MDLAIFKSRELDLYRDALLKLNETGECTNEQLHHLQYKVACFNAFIKKHGLDIQEQTKLL